MSTFAGLPLPEGAPPEGGCWRLERPEPGLLRLVLDPPHRPKLAVFDVAVLRDLAHALDEIERDGAAKALVITGRNPLSFAGGADIDAIASIEDGEAAAEMVRTVHGLFDRIAALGRENGGRLRTVAAVGGPVPGGACEITLCCDRTVLADHPKTRIGLPEVKLGILPAWGGTTRLPRRIGVPGALGAILTGRLYRARQAKKLGIVDRTTHPEYLLDVASDIAMERAKCPRRRRGWRGVLVDKNPLVGAIIAHQARKGVLKQTRGRYPAPLAVIPVAVRAPRVSVASSLAAEVEAVMPLATSPVTKSLVGLFRLSEDAKRLGKLPDGTDAEPIRRAATLGAGVMGGAIASLIAEKGIESRLRDLDRGALDAALRAHQKEIGKKKKRRRLQRHEADRALDLLEGTTEELGFGRCDIVIEAVAEVLEVKRKVFTSMAALMPPGAILATNTSSLSVDAIAEGVPDPERVVGMHFFNPVRKMPLVEIIRGEKTTDEVVARTARLALDLGKTPVVCKDVAGFLVNRLLGPYLDEAVRCLEEGADPKALDEALLDFGMPMGPCELLDEVGLDIAAHAAASLEAAYGARMVGSTHLAPLTERGDLGKKTGAGIYLWKPGKKGRLENAGVNPAGPRGSAGGSSPASWDAEEAVDRTVLAMLNEAARALEEEVVAGPRELDLATVFGMGFAPFHGGLLRWADTRGLSAVADSLTRIAALPKIAGRDAGEARFTPAPLLAELAGAGRTFHG